VLNELQGGEADPSVGVDGDDLIPGYSERGAPANEAADKVPETVRRGSVSQVG
jgi:hypothetical protein